MEVVQPGEATVASKPRLLSLCLARLGWLISKNGGVIIGHMLHGAGIFTYKAMSFMG